MTTTSINAVDAKEDFSELVNRVSHNKERVILLRRGKEVAALIPIEDLALIEESQGKNDLEEAGSALKEARTEGFISLDDLQEKMG